MVVVQGLHSRAIDCTEQNGPGAIPDCKRPHSVQPLEAVLSPLVVCLEEHLSVRTRAKATTQRLEFGAKLDIVVDLAVECQPQPIVEHHRLVTCGGPIDDRKPSVRKCHGPSGGSSFYEEAEIIRTAVRLNLCHLFYCCGGVLRV